MLYPQGQSVSEISFMDLLILVEILHTYALFCQQPLFASAGTLQSYQCNKHGALSQRTKSKRNLVCEFAHTSTKFEHVYFVLHHRVYNKVINTTNTVQCPRGHCKLPKLM